MHTITEFDDIIMVRRYPKHSFERDPALPYETGPLASCSGHSLIAAAESERWANSRFTVVEERVSATMLVLSKKGYPTIRYKHVCMSFA